MSAQSRILARVNRRGGAEARLHPRSRARSQAGKLPGRASASPICPRSGNGNDHGPAPQWLVQAILAVSVILRFSRLSRISPVTICFAARRALHSVLGPRLLGCAPIYFPGGCLGGGARLLLPMSRDPNTDQKARGAVADPTRRPDAGSTSTGTHALMSGIPTSAAAMRSTDEGEPSTLYPGSGGPSSDDRRAAARPDGTPRSARQPREPRRGDRARDQQSPVLCHPRHARDYEGDRWRGGHRCGRLFRTEDLRELVMDCEGAVDRIRQLVLSLKGIGRDGSKDDLVFDPNRAIRRRRQAIRRCQAARVSRLPSWSLLLCRRC